MDIDRVACVIVTRGDTDLTPILDSLPTFPEVVVWNNQKRLQNARVLGRYLAITETSRPYIYTQDDDAICPAADLVTVYQGDGLLVNVPPGEHPFVGWGAIFPRNLPQAAIADYVAAYGVSDDVYRWPDVIVAHLSGSTSIDLGHQDLPWATSPDRMYQQPDHYQTQSAVRERCARIGGG